MAGASLYWSVKRGAGCIVILFYFRQKIIFTEGAKKMTDRLKTYTLVEAAEVLHCTRQTVYAYVIDGRIRGNKIGSRWIIAEEELQYIINNGLRDKTN